MLHSVIVII